ncbi:hypothetical protein V1264_020492 [Littorina saxatilis]|uniref:Uncharacterized protein n=1 Tax=Littorina saxatilis TaxID=31220 RepID=A0AAN9BB30_9CAEN
MTGMRTRVVNPAQLRRRRLFPLTRKMLYPVGRCSGDNSFYPRKHDMREMNNDDFSPRKSDVEVFCNQQYSWWSRKKQRRHTRGTNVDKTNTRMGGHRSSPSRSEKPSRAAQKLTFQCQSGYKWS